MTQASDAQSARPVSMPELALVGRFALLWDHRVAILTVVIALGAVLSPMPSRDRDDSFLHRRVVKGGESG